MTSHETSNLPIFHCSCGIWRFINPVNRLLTPAIRSWPLTGIALVNLLDNLHVLLPHCRIMAPTALISLSKLNLASWLRDELSSLHCHMSKNVMDLLWAAGINGEGSSVVTFGFVECFLACQGFSDVCIVYTAKSTLSARINSLNACDIEKLSSRNIRLVRLPKACRLYPIHFLIKCFFPVNIWFRRCVVFDDFPFRLCPRQLLYFHQSNLIFSSSLLWKIKRIAFVMLKPKSLTVNFQTFHVRDSFVRAFGKCKSLCFLHQV